MLRNSKTGNPEDDKVIELTDIVRDGDIIDPADIGEGEEIIELTDIVEIGRE